jgi:hypothetical protein
MKQKRTSWKDSEFTKFIRIKKETLDVIKNIKGKKSIAGKLEEIIWFYISSKKL